MMNPAAQLSAFLAILFLTLGNASACTTTGVTKSASSLNSVLSSQSNDGDATTDTRLFLVPAADHPHGSKRPVFGWAGGNYPRYVGEDRGKMNYVRKDGQKLSEPIGYIDEVEHTYAYYDGTFGLLNEHGVGIAD